MNLFLKPFIDELIELHNAGFFTTTFLHVEPISIKVHTLLAPVDSVARCAVQNLKQYNGIHGCTYCLHPGEEIEFGDRFTRVYCGDRHQGRTWEQHKRDVKKVVNQKKLKDINGVNYPSFISSIRSHPSSYIL